MFSSIFDKGRVVLITGGVVSSKLIVNTAVVDKFGCGLPTSLSVKVTVTIP